MGGKKKRLLLQIRLIIFYFVIQSSFHNGRKRYSGGIEFDQKSDGTFHEVYFIKRPGRCAGGYICTGWDLYCLQDNGRLIYGCIQPTTYAGHCSPHPFGTYRNWNDRPTGQENERESLEPNQSQTHHQYGATSFNRGIIPINLAFKRAVRPYCCLHPYLLWSVIGSCGSVYIFGCAVAGLAGDSFRANGSYIAGI